MKKFIILFGLFTSISVLGISQNDYYEFLRARPSGDGLTTFFDFVGLDDSIIIEQLISDLRNDEDIYRADYFKLKNGKDRIHIFYSKNIDANYVRAYLQAYELEYDFSTVLKNGELQRSEDDKVRLESYRSEQNSIENSTFPDYQNFDNDNQYRTEKDKWIEENPEEYNQLLEDLKKNN